MPGCPHAHIVPADVAGIDAVCTDCGAKFMEVTDEAPPVIVKRICDVCNKEFIVTMSPVGDSQAVTLCRCTHCNVVNHIWINVTVKGKAQVSNS